MTRLIDADALKESIDKFHQQENDRLRNPLWGSIGLNVLNRLIDNAPTVPLPDFKEGYKQAILDGKTNYSRPQGEWEYQYSFLDEDLYKCTHCGRLLSIHNVQDISEFHFCQECGAEMEVKKNE